MKDQTSEHENTRRAYEETPQHRTDYTPGDWPIPQSPFKTKYELARAMSELTGQDWHVGYFDTTWHGGRGDCQYIFSGDDEITVWRDASGGYHPERKVGANWLPDLDLLYKLIEASKMQEFDSEPACGNYTESEVAYMRHPD